MEMRAEEGREEAKRDERGFTLLEYCAGAAVIATVMWVAFDAFGGSLTSFFEGLGTWVRARTPSS